jgi:hypothetical protein
MDFPAYDDVNPTPIRTRTDLKRLAQDTLMTGIANQLSYWKPQDEGIEMTPEKLEEFQEIMKREADRVARMFGYEEAWRN